MVFINSFTNSSHSFTKGTSVRSQTYLDLYTIFNRWYFWGLGKTKYPMEKWLKTKSGDARKKKLEQGADVEKLKTDKVMSNSWRGLEGGERSAV